MPNFKNTCILHSIVLSASLLITTPAMAQERTQPLIINADNLQRQLRSNSTAPTSSTVQRGVAPATNKPSGSFWQTIMPNALQNTLNNAGQSQPVTAPNTWQRYDLAPGTNPLGNFVPNNLPTVEKGQPITGNSQSGQGFQGNQYGYNQNPDAISGTIDAPSTLLLQDLISKLTYRIEQLESKQKECCNTVHSLAQKPFNAMDAASQASFIAATKKAMDQAEVATKNTEFLKYHVHTYWATEQGSTGPSPKQIPSNTALPMYKNDGGSTTKPDWSSPNKFPQTGTWP